MSADASLFDALITGNARKVMNELYPQKPQPEHGSCDICEERPGDRVIKVSGLCVCDECDEQEHARALRFHTDDDAAADEAGVRARGEI